MSPEATARLQQRWHWLTLLGLALLTCGVLHPRCLGFPTGLLLLLSGGLAGAFGALRRGRGVWMLSALALPFWLALYVVLQVEAHRLQPNRGEAAFWLRVLDALAAAAVAWQTARLLACVTRLNWHLSRGTLPRRAYPEQYRGQSAGAD
jgi:hypothetical protein